MGRELVSGRELVLGSIGEKKMVVVQGTRKSFLKNFNKVGTWAKVRNIGSIINLQCKLR